MLVYQVGVARRAELNLSNRFPEKREISFGRNHAGNTLSGAPQRDRQRDVRLGPGRSVDRAYIILTLERFDEFERFTLVGEIGGKLDFSVGYFHDLHTFGVDIGSVGEAAVFFDQEPQD